MKSPPSIWLSIVLPAYNVEPFLDECFQSIATQWTPGIEVIIVEDRSTDGTLAELTRIQRDVLPCLSVIRHEQNQGLSGARNTGLNAARGDYVWFLDSDDLIAPGCIDRLRSIVERHQPDLVLCDFRMLRTPMKLKHRLRGELHRCTFEGPHETLLRDRELLLNGVFGAGHLHTWSKIARRALWGEDLRFPVGRYFEDALTTPELLLRARSYYHAHEPWVVYRQREGSILATMNPRKIDDMLHAFDGFSQRLLDPRSGLRREHLFGVEFHMTRNFNGACKHLRRLPPGLDRDQRLAEAGRTYREALPNGVGSVIRGYARRLWLNRLGRLGYWLWRTGAKAHQMPSRL